MGKGSIAKIAAALAIISVYIYLFGIVGTIDSLDSNLAEQMSENTAQTFETTEPPQPDDAVPVIAATTTAAPRPEKVIYTYSTQLNVANGKKPSLADYTATEAILVVTQEMTAAAATTTVPADFELSEDDVDYTTPVKTTTTTAAATTTTTAATELTSASTSIVTMGTTTTVPPETTTTTVETTTEAETTTTTTTPEETTASAETEISETAVETTTEATTTAETTTAEETTTEVSVPETNIADETLTVNAGGTIVTDTASVIVAKAVMAEIGDSFSEEAIKAQAVAAYTYIKYYNQNNQNAYVLFKTPSDKVTRCVNEVIGQGIYYNGSLIQAVYFASSAGSTASSVNVWGVDYPYLRSVAADFDALYDINYGRKATFTSDEIRVLVQNNTGIALDGDPSTWFAITSRIDGNFVGSMTIGGQESFYNGSKTVTITGRVFRETIMEYGIRSASFDIVYDASTGSFVITTYGYGHCVGMSQHGANILATQYGYNYEQILKYYYQGVTIA